MIVPLLLSLSVTGGRAARTTAIQHPDIVVVVADDMPQLDGRLIDFMPTVRSVFRERGLTFTDFHGETPTCCPGRAGLLSGQHTTNHGVARNQSGLFNPIMSLATQLHAVGYHTMLAGKYMNLYGSCRKVNCAPSVPPGWDRWFAFNQGHGFYDYDVWVDGAPTPVHYGSAPEDYATDVLADRAVTLISESPADQPIFAWLAPVSPHAPNHPAPRHMDASCPVPAWRPANYKEADVSDKPAWVQAIPLTTNNKNELPVKCRMLLSVDELIADVRAALAARSRLADTLFIFTGDNGMAWYEHRLNGKGDPYQTRLPFLVSWPARLGESPRSVPERLQNIDLAPTLCELAGCTMGPYPNGQTRPDGVSFLGLLLGTENSVNRESIFENMPKGNKPAPPWFAVTTTRESPLAAIGCADAPAGGCLWHYIEYPVTGEEELYDLSNGPCWEWTVGGMGDPCELENRASDPTFADLKAALRTELARLKAEKGFPFH